MPEHPRTRPVHSWGGDYEVPLTHRVSAGAEGGVVDPVLPVPGDDPVVSTGDPVIGSCPVTQRVTLATTLAIHSPPGARYLVAHIN